MGYDIWTWLYLGDDGLDEADLGLIPEARRMTAESGEGRVMVLAAGADAENLLPRLGRYGADGVVHLQSPHLAHYHGELFAGIVAAMLAVDPPGAVLFAHRGQTVDLAARLGAILDRPVITRAVDAHWDERGRLQAQRPIANGYLFETLETIEMPDSERTGTVFITFLPDVLPDPRDRDAAVLDMRVVTPEADPRNLATQTVEIIAADPETLAVEEADIVVAAGRGAIKGGAFDEIRRLSMALGGSVGGTRPVIDEHLLPFECQIGQTGKTVTPRLILNCGISGANEYTAGMEKSQLVIAVNTDARARIFRFADLGIVGDVHTVLPLLTERLEKMGNDAA
jgi:electron transfer flavoprotein alpha subunit